jgi:transposase-like protein
MKKRRSYPKAMKQKVVLEWLETPGRMSAVARDHGVTCSMISKWKKDPSLFHQVSNEATPLTPTERSKKKNHPEPALKRPDLDDYLYAYYHSLRQEEKASTSDPSETILSS